MKAKPSFDEFHLAMLYPTERERLGIPLDSLGAHQLLIDHVALVSYYSQWTPTFVKITERKRLPRGPHELKRNILGWLMLGVIIGAIVTVLAIAANTALAAATHTEPGGIYIPDWVD